MKALTTIALIAISLAVGPGAQAASKAANYVAERALADACGRSGGRYEPGAILERDLTGDGRPDLVLDHNRISCPGGRSLYCGAQACSVLIYVRDRRGLLKQRLDLLSIGFEYGPGSRPRIGTIGHGGVASSFRWQNGKFR